MARPLFQTGVQLLRLALVEAGADLAERRAGFARRVAGLLERIDRIEQGAGDAASGDRAAA